MVGFVTESILIRGDSKLKSCHFHGTNMEAIQLKQPLLNRKTEDFTTSKQTLFFKLRPF